MLSPIEILAQRLCAAGALIGGITGTALAEFDQITPSKWAAIISLGALLVNWYYQRRRTQLLRRRTEFLRRRDAREQAIFEKEMNNEQHQSTTSQEK